MELEVVKFSSTEQGCNLLITGGVHGNEPCGPTAIKRIINDFESGKIKLGQGSVTFIPECNPKALQQNVRFIDVDLNRIMRPNTSPELYEEHLCNQICTEIEKSDAFLDVHSYEAGDIPFVFLGPQNEAELDFASALGGEYFIHNWKNAYEQGHKDANIPISGDKNAKAPTSLAYYAKENGVPSLTIECGQNGGENAETVAYNAILNALEYWCDASVDADIPRVQKVPNQKIIELKTVFFKTATSQKIEQFENFQKLKKGQLVAAFEDGKTLNAPEDGFAVLPYKTPVVGDKIAIFGVEQSKDEYLGQKNIPVNTFERRFK